MDEIIEENDNADFFDTQNSFYNAEVPGSESNIRLLIPPINSTLRSQGNKSVVILKPTNNRSNLFRNPTKLTELIANSPFGKIEMNDVRTNKKKTDNDI